jgi:protein-arginine kinase activator protein McsA
MRAASENADRLRTLQKKLEKAVESEKFEEAAQLRDEIKQISERSTAPRNLTR